MELEVNKVIMHALYYFYKANGLMAITWDYVQNYIGVLEELYGTKIKLISEGNTKYEDCFTCEINNSVIKFRLTNIDKSLLDDELSLNKTNTINISAMNDQIKKIKSQSIKYYHNIKINSHDLFHLFMYVYNKMYGNSIEIENANEAMSDLKNICGKLKIAINDEHRSYKSSMHQFNIYENNIITHISNNEEYLREINKRYTQEQFEYLVTIIAEYATNKKFQEKARIYIKASKNSSN